MLLQYGGQQARALFGAGLHGQLKAHSVISATVARLVQQPLRPCRIVLVPRNLIGPRPVPLRQQTVCRLRMTPQQCLDNQPAVNRPGNRLPHPRIGKQRIAHVEGQVLNLRPARLLYL